MHCDQRFFGVRGLKVSWVRVSPMFQQKATASTHRAANTQLVRQIASLKSMIRIGGSLASHQSSPLPLALCTEGGVKRTTKGKAKFLTGFRKLLTTPQLAQHVQMSSPTGTYVYSSDALIEMCRPPGA